MDEGTQKEITPAYTSDQKISIVKQLLYSKYDITDYSEIIRLITDNHIQPLCPTRMKEGGYTSISEAETYFKFLTDIASGAIQAPPDEIQQAYYQIFAIFYALKRDGHIKVSDEDNMLQVGKIDTVLSDLRSTLSSVHSRLAKIEKMLAPSDSEEGYPDTESESRIDELIKKYDDVEVEMTRLGNALYAFEGTVSDLRKTMEERDTKITTILSILEKWMAAYKDTLERAKKEYDRINPVERK